MNWCFAQPLSPYFSNGNKQIFKSSSDSKHQTLSLPTDLFGYHTFFKYKLEYLIFGWLVLFVALGLALMKATPRAAPSSG